MTVEVLHDALVSSMQRFDRARFELACWESAARGETFASSAAPASAFDVVLDARDYASRLRAARSLFTLADSISDAKSLQLANKVTLTAATWLAHSEPLLWCVAARALGRLAARVSSARDLARAWSASDAAWQRGVATRGRGSIPPGTSEDAWIDDELDRASEANDPWRVAALAIAAPHLARERPERWSVLLEQARTGQLEVAWSVAQGLGMIGRRHGGRALSGSEHAAIAEIRAGLFEPSRSTEEAARVVEIEVQLARALGATAPAELALETGDDAVRAHFGGCALPSSDTPPFTSLLDALDDPDEHVRGRAHAALRSRTRAAAARIDELAGRALVDDAPAIARTIRDRLAKEICEYGLRSTLLACLGDLTEVAQPGTRVSDALHAVAGSRWIVEMVQGQPDDKLRARAVRRFRKPLDDFFGRFGERGSLPPKLAAWWALCVGDALLLGELDRRSSRPTIAIREALRTAAFGGSVSAWSARIDEALEALDAASSLLARGVHAIVTAIEGASDDELAAGDRFGALAAAIEVFVQVAEDFEAAVAKSPPSATRLPRFDVVDRDAAIARWQRTLPQAIGEIVVPIARALDDQIRRAAEVRRVPGARIGGFELVEKLGGGGMGDVWKARRGRQLVALKLPHSDAQDLLRFESERLEQLSLAKVATFIEHGADGNVPFLATGYLRGRTWQEHALGAHRMTVELALRITRDVCIGLANLHEIGVVHRDLTPRNVFLRFRGRDPMPVPALHEDPEGRRLDEAVLIDLGIAQRIGDAASPYFSFGYVAPEILLDEPVGPAADVYGLGATLFHVLTGRRFAEGLTRGDAAAWHLAGDPFDDAKIRDAAQVLPPELAGLISAATRRDPAARLSLEMFDGQI